MVKLIEPHSEGELAVIKSLLEGNGIRYYVQNEFFGGLYPGFPLPFNRRVVMVEENELERAEVLLSWIGRSAPDQQAG